ncbi:hypothetical protein WSM22_44130 [Cytophagales bacterium WSM2-2]|nr:hypothetical protein WSM22_44130 [Cytophagales bacterium WSM2-2]
MKKILALISLGLLLSNCSSDKYIVRSDERKAELGLSVAPSLGSSVLSRTTGHNVLIMVDNREISFQEMNKIDPNTIRSIQVLKGEEQVKKYTTGKYEGVVLIELRKS